MQRIKLTNKQVELVRAIRAAASIIALNNGVHDGYVPSQVAIEICYMLFGISSRTSSIFALIESFDPQILFSRPRDFAIISRRAPKPNEINSGTPTVDKINNAQLAHIVEIRMGIEVVNLPKDRVSVFKNGT